ncbi:MAG: hypothetical protein HGA87_00180 [Desulfobulbaceae bacterium]|nr:hypothetical protein [Desulfobulbaceae bacterium]
MAQNYLYGVNLGEAIQTGQALRKNNMLLADAEKEQAMQPKINQSRQNAAGGDDQAFQWLMANDPKIGEFVQAVDRMDDISRKRTAERTEQIGGVIVGLYERIQSAPTTEERQALWSTFYKNAPAEVQKELGEQYNPTKLAVSVSRLLGMKHYADKALLGERAQYNRQEMEYKNQFTAGENEKDRQSKLDAARLSGGGAAGKPATPAMERITAALDPYFGQSARDDDDVTGEQRKWITAAAMANMQSGRAKNETEAVRQAVDAFKKKGFTIGETRRQPTSNSPSGKKTLGVTW